jgi:hypothetical protein
MNFSTFYGVRRAVQRADGVTAPGSPEAENPWPGLKMNNSDRRRSRPWLS